MFAFRVRWSFLSLERSVCRASLIEAFLPCDASSSVSTGYPWLHSRCLSLWPEFCWACARQLSDSSTLSNHADPWIQFSKFLHEFSFLLLWNWGKITCLYTPSFPNKGRVVPPTAMYLPGPQHSYIDKQRTEFLGISQYLMGRLTHSFQLSFGYF